jgi:hypothetical protein
MDEEFMRELRRFQQYTGALQSLLAQAQAKAPERSEGRDPSGAVQVIAGPDGFPQAIRIGDGWQRRVEATALQGAVMQAYEAAMGDRLNAWSRDLDEADWRGKVDRLENDPNPGEPFPEPEPAAPANGPEGVTPRPLDEIAEAVLSGADAVAGMSSEPPTGKGSAASGRVTVSLTPHGMTTCSLDTAWAAGRSGGTLTEAFAEAITAARTDLERARREAERNPAAGMEGLINEAIAILRDPRRLA